MKKAFTKNDGLPLIPGKTRIPEKGEGEFRERAFPS
jgi:hypothetical protein